jgi:CRISPR-associated exonuclease Cas4
MNNPNDPVPLSALQHYLYCPRQCALIHVERVWAENRATAEGRVLHENADSGHGESRPGVRISRTLVVASAQHNLVGVCDIVEFHKDGRIVPIEYKRGRPKSHRADEVQICAQAICLESQFNLEEGSIDSGFLFYGKQKRRTLVLFDSELRQLTLSIAAKVAEMKTSGQTPTASYTPKLCDLCSLKELCQPKAMRYKRGTAAWFERNLAASQT